LQDKDYKYELSIVMPCLDEAETVGLCVQKAIFFLVNNGINGEVIVADNGSSDGSQKIAEENGARVVYVSEKGYGSALIGGINETWSKYIIMGDSDDSHDLENLMPFVDKLRDGNDFVVGNRFIGGIDPGAMSFINKYIGNPFLSGIGRIFFKSKVRDFHCGLRGFTKEAFDKLDLRTSGMEFASEMIVKATLSNMKITEVPTRMSPAGRTRPPHLRSFSDGWRHLRFLLLYSPRWLFLYPGLTLILFGLIIALWLLPGSKLSLDVHTMLYAASAIIIGFQSVSFAVLTKIFAVSEKLLPVHPKLEKILSFATLEKGLIIGGIMVIGGFGTSFYALLLLPNGGFHALGITNTMRLVITSITFLIVGFQVIFSSFFYSILRLKLR
jgi:glycosyltransferase involved in cell wall biosynthesis